MRTRFIAVALALPALAAFAGPEMTSAFRPETIQARIAYLASDELAGRESGTKGNELAARFVADAFRKAGLKRVGTAKQTDAGAKPDGSGYFQPFAFTAGRAAGKNNVLQVLVAGKKRSWHVGAEFEPALISATGKAAGNLVFAGRGIVSKERDDYGGLDVKGKVVLVLADSPSADPRSGATEFPDNLQKVIAARDKGAAALILVQPEDGVWPRLGGERMTGDAGIPVVLLRRSVAAEWLKESGQDLAAIERDLAQGPRARVLGVRIAALSTDVRKVTKTTANVVGLLEGSDPALRNEVVVIGAHLDHLGMGGPASLSDSRTPQIHHGADDNASGTAGVMALADYFSSLSTRPKRSILFMAFSGEELGLLGSAHYVKDPIVPLDRTVAMLNMDMIGRMAANKLIISGSGTSPAWNALLDAVNGTAKFSVTRSESGFGASDQQSFYTAKIPVLFFFTGLHADYHRPSDTADKINAADESRVLEMVADCAARIADMPDRPAFQQIAVAQDSGPARFRVSLGSIPDYAAEVEGVQLSGVRPGSPAEIAGLKAGDIIVKFGDKTVRNVQEYTVALGVHKPGDVVAIVVKRGPETLTLTATLAESRR
jgi:aminopeptidase YwaD